MDKRALIAAEEQERILREEYDEANAEVHGDKKAVVQAEEEERNRRVVEDEKATKENMDKLFAIYKFRDEIKEKAKDK